MRLIDADEFKYDFEVYTRGFQRVIKPQKGNVKAYEMIRDTIEEKPVERVETKQTIVDMSKFTTEERKDMLDEEV